MNKLTVELMAVGTWKNIKFIDDDLKGMAKDFMSLKNVLFAPVKLGHNDEQEITDGMPSLGEIGKVWYSKAGKDGKPKLMGELEGLPDVVYKAISKKRYNKLSIEVDRDVTYKDRFMKFVLTGVALLGADLPAVNTLSDLNAYMGRKSLFTDSKTKVCFTKDFSYDNLNEDIDMSTELEEARKRIADLEKEQATFKDEARDNKTKLETFTREDKERVANDTKAKVIICRKTVTAVFEKAVKDEVITPAQRDQFTKLLNVDNDEAVLNISTDDVEALLKESGGKMFTKGKTRSDNTERKEADAGSELTTEAYDIMNKNANMEFSTAFSRAMKANPELAKEHMENKPH